MEIINDRKQPLSAGNIYVGAVLILAGVVWLLSNLGAVPHYMTVALFSWQSLFVVIGGYLLAIRRWIMGALFVVLGAASGLACLCGVWFPFHQLVLPVLLITLGVAFLVRK